MLPANVYLNWPTPTSSLSPEFAQYNCIATPVIWDDPTIDWTTYDAVIIRNTWDYYTKYTQFIEWLDTLERAKVMVLNGLPIIRKNSHKFYLKDIESNGFSIIPTFFLDKNTVIPPSLSTDFDKMVLKPAISAGSYQTVVLTKEGLSSKNILSKIDDGEWLLQPFLPEIQSEGEISIIFFGDEFSHAIIKKPVGGDFRVQKQFGGQYVPYSPSKQLLDELKPVFKVLGDRFLFGRIDGVILNGVFHIMEVEMLEPDLYFDLFPEKVSLFCKKAMALLNVGC